MSPQQSPGVSPPLSAIYPDNQAGKIWIVTILATIYVVLSALVRGFIKWGIYGVDDYLLAIATIIFIGQSGAIFHALNHGLSKFNSITTKNEWDIAGRSFLASEVLTILTLCLTKCSVLFLMHRVFSSNVGWRVWLRIATLCLSVVWGVGGMAAIATNCNADTVLTSRSVRDCPRQIGRWRIITITDISTEALICLLPIALTWPLQMPLKKKLQVLIAFGLRLPVVVLSTLHFFRLKEYPATAEPLYSVTDVLIQQQSMLLWSLVSATIPNMKAFIQSFSFEFGLGMGLSTSQKSSDYPMKNLTIGSAQSKKWRKTNLSTYDDGGGGISSSLRPDPHRHKSVVVHGTGDRGSIGSHGSQDLIIRKVVDWHVHSESTDRDSVQV